MKPFILCTILISGSTLLLSCGEKKQDTVVPLTHDTPEALQDNKLEIKSYGRSSKDLVEELYAELMEQDASLKKLEEDLNTHRQRPGELNDAFNHYHSKSTDYYVSANQKTEVIHDSVLKQKINAFIKRSNQQYSKKTVKANELLSQISENNLSIQDQHLALKIVLTMPLIEKFQSGNAIPENQFKDLIKEQNELLKEMDKLSPEF
jgi:hypothetical protein